MEVYTTSFTYPRSSHPHHPASSRDLSSANHPYNHPHQHANTSSDSALALDSDAIQKLTIMAMSLHGCHISYHMLDNGRGWNFHVTGAYQQVMLARGMILKECPVQVPSFFFCSFSLTHQYCSAISSAPSNQHRAAIKVARSEILDFLSSKPSLKQEVRRRLDEIASQTFAHIAVVNSPLALSNRTPPDGISNSAGWSWLETERVCELVITGSEDAVDLARVRLLVMLDELVRICHSVLSCLFLTVKVLRVGSMLSIVKSTTNYTPLLPAASERYCSLYKKRRPPISTSLPLFKEYLVQTTPPRCPAHRGRLVTLILYISPANFLECNALETCCTRFPSPR